MSNKYTASLHFSFAGTTEIRAQDATDGPACIFVVFNPTNDEFITTMERVEDLRLSSCRINPPTTAEKRDDLKGFFGEHGFEYVNDSTGSGIRRIIQALSTILWLSMVQKSGKRAKMRSMVSVPELPEDGLRSLLNVDKDPTESSRPLQREMAALEKWPEDGGDDEKDPWVGMDLTQANHSAASIVEDDTDGDPVFPSQDEVESMSQRLREIEISEDIGEMEVAGISDEDEKGRQPPRQLWRWPGSMRMFHKIPFIAISYRC
ncbi:hypothetical protein JB92DRAFT_3101090 [Gautieria morchelliformis]|nr:hypothetical protein JB92DRAFT_3101090 [Gautieria morchelliformis]